MEDQNKIEALIKDLQDKDWNVRESAIKVLGNLRDPRIIPSILERLQDEIHSVRRAAISVLGKIGGEDAIMGLQQALEDPDRFNRQQAVEILDHLRWQPRNTTEQARYFIAKNAWEDIVKIGNQVVPFLISQLQKETRTRRRAVITALGEIGDTRGINPLIEIMLEENPEMQQVVITALGQIGGEQVVETVIQALQFEDYKVRKTAVEVLGHLGDQQAITALINTLKTDTNPYVREKAVEALGVSENDQVIEALIAAFGDPELKVRKKARETVLTIGKPAADALLQVLKAVDTELLIRQGVVNVIGQMGDQRAVESLLEELNNKDMCLLAVDALGRLGDPRAIDPLLPFLEEGGQIRSVAAWALGKIGDERVIEPLIQKLPYLNRDTRRETVTELGNRRDARAIPVLIQILQDDAEDVRRAAGRALIKFGNEIVVPLLEVLQEDEVQKARETAADALGELGDERAIDPLLQILHQEEWAVRTHAARALGAIGGSRVAKALITRLTDDEESVRWLAAIALEKADWEPKDKNERAQYLVATNKWNKAAKIGFPAVEPLIRALKTTEKYSDKEFVQKKVVEALVEIGNPAIGRLQEALQHPNSIIRQGAAMALEQASDWTPSNVREKVNYLIAKQAWEEVEQVGEPAVQSLIQMLKVAQKDSTYSSIEGALTSIGSAAVKPLMQMLQDALPKNRENAARILGRINDPQAVDPMIQALYKDPSVQVRQAVITGLSQFEDEKVVDPLHQALHDHEFSVRILAAKTLTLKDLGDPTIVKTIIEKAITEFLAELDQLFETFIAQTWPTMYDEEFVKACIQAIKALFDEYEELLRVESLREAILPVLRQWFSQDHWTSRACGFLFYYAAQIFEKEHRELRSLVQRIEKSILKEIQIGPELWNVELFVRAAWQLAHHWGVNPWDSRYAEPIHHEWQVSPEFELSTLIARLPELNRRVQAQYFTFAVSIIIQQSFEGDSSHVTSDYVAIAELPLQRHSLLQKGLKRLGVYKEIRQSLLYLWDRIPPSELEQWASIGVTLLTEGAWPDWYEDEFEAIIKKLGPMIIQIKDLKLFRRFLQECDHYAFADKRWRDHYNTLWHTEYLFDEVIQTKWFEGAEPLLETAAGSAAKSYTSDSAAACEIDTLWTETATHMFKTYMEAGGDVTFSVASALYRLYVNAKNFGKPIIPELSQLMIQTGRMIEQQDNNPLREILLEHTFFLPLQGMLEVALSTGTQERVITILTTFIESHKKLWLPNSDAKFEWWSTRESPSMDLWAFSPRFRGQENLRPARDDYLSILAPLILQPSLDTTLIGGVLADLYQTHGIWTLRLLTDTIHYVLAHTSLLGILEIVGEIWTKSAIETTIQTSPDDTDFPWLITTLQACAAEPDVYPELVQCIQDETQPLNRRNFAILLLSRVGSQAVKLLLELTQNEFPEFRRSSALALGRIGEVNTFNALVNLLNDPENDVKGAAIIALGRLGDKRAVPPLIEMWKELSDVTEQISQKYTENWAELMLLEFENLLLPLGTIESAVKRSLDHLQRMKMAIKLCLQQFGVQVE